MPNCPIVRVGASVAARKFKRGQGEEAYPDMLFAITNRAGGVRELGTLGFNARVAATDPKKWIGEATRWRTRERPSLPVAGISHWFQTTQDAAETATHPVLLERVAQALLADVREFLG